MLDGGVYLSSLVFGAWFVSAACGEEAVSRVADVLPGAGRATTEALGGVEHLPRRRHAQLP